MSVTVSAEWPNQTENLSVILLQFRNNAYTIIAYTVPCRPDCCIQSEHLFVPCRQEQQKRFSIALIILTGIDVITDFGAE